MDAVNLQKAVEYVLLCMNFDGGFGCRPGSESHAGQVNSTGLLSFNSFELLAILLVINWSMLSLGRARVRTPCLA